MTNKINGRKSAWLYRRRCLYRNYDLDNQSLRDPCGTTKVVRWKGLRLAFGVRVLWILRKIVAFWHSHQSDLINIIRAGPEGCQVSSLVTTQKRPLSRVRGREPPQCNLDYCACSKFTSSFFNHPPIPFPSSLIPCVFPLRWSVCPRSQTSIRTWNRASQRFWSRKS